MNERAIVPTDASAISGRRTLPGPAGAQLLATAAASVAEQCSCSHDAAFDALIDVARRNHISVATAAKDLLSRPSVVPARCEPQHPRPTVDLASGSPDVGGSR